MISSVALKCGVIAYILRFALTCVDIMYIFLNSSFSFKKTLFLPYVNQQFEFEV